jgi:hypothetical protein
VSYKPVDTATFIRWLKAKGLIGYKQKSGTSHEVWDYPPDTIGLRRPVTIRPHYSTIPARHIESNLGSMGISQKTFEDELILFGIVKRKGSKKGKKGPK